MMFLSPLVLVAVWACLPKSECPEFEEATAWVQQAKEHQKAGRVRRSGDAVTPRAEDNRRGRSCHDGGAEPTGWCALSESRLHRGRGHCSPRLGIELATG